MAKPKAKSMLQQLGFFDEELASADHDTIIEWVDDKASEIIREFFPTYFEWSKEEVSHAITTAQRVIEDEIRFLENDEDNDHSSYVEYLNRVKDLQSLGEIPPRNPAKVRLKQWEYPIKDIRGRGTYIIGYIDMRIQFSYSNLYVEGIDYNRRSVGQNLHWTQSELENNDPQENRPHVENLFVEAKTKLPTMGELMRQMNTYRDYSKGAFLIVCPDDSKAEKIRTQEYHFLKYTG